MIFFFFWQKQNYILSFKSIENKAIDESVIYNE